MPVPVAPESLRAGDVALLGIRYDAGSTYMRGPAEAPPAIRAALHSGSANLCAESGHDLGSDIRFQDVGDRSIGANEAAYLGIANHVAAIVQQRAKPLILGGDHAITYPVLRAMADRHGPLHILHFDAHPDLYDHYEGNRYAHACPFARIMEAGLASHLVQVGIRTMNPHQHAQAERFGVEVHTMATLDLASFQPEFDGPVYISFDLDVLDPAFAPGVSHHEPGGLSTREALRMVQRLSAPVLGADVVEYNPRRDVHGMTAMVAAKLVKELAALMLTEGR